MYNSEIPKEYVTKLRRLERRIIRLEEEVYKKDEELEKIKKKEEEQKKQTVNVAVIEMRDDEIIEQVLKGKDGSIFSMLYGGYWQRLCNTIEEADYTLMNMLAYWTGCNIEVMDRLFRKSALMRKEYDKVYNGEKYGYTLIKQAIKNCKEIYAPNGYYQIKIN